MQSPLIPVTISFILGIVSSLLFDLNPLIPISIAILFLILAFSFVRKIEFGILFMSAVFFYSLFLTLDSKWISSSDISNFIDDKAKHAVIKGVVASDPELIFEKGEKSVIKKARFIVKVAALKTETEREVNGFLYVTAKNKIFLKYGDEGVFEGRISKPPKAESPEEFDYRKYLAGKKIRGLFKIAKSDNITVILNKAPATRRFIYSLRHLVERKIFEYNPTGNAELLRAMILGIRFGFDRNIEDKFIKTGTVHILAISGLNIGMILLLVIVVLKILRFTRKTRYLAAAFIIAALTLFCGAQPPVVRAALMAEIFLIGLFLERANSGENAFFISALLILNYNPLQLFDPSFQLSFLSIWGLIYITPRINSWFIKGSTRKNSVIGNLKFYFLMSLSASIAAILGVLPVVIYYFGIVSYFAVVINLIVIPLVFFIMSSGAAFIFFSFINSIFAVIFAELAGIFINALMWSVDIFSKIPQGYFFIERPPLFLIAAYYLLLFFVLKIKKPIFKDITESENSIQ